MIIRRYKTEDCQEMAKLFYDTVHSVNIKDYTEEQVNVWATGYIDLETWNEKLLKFYTVVAVDNENGVITGFGNIDETGYVDFLYVHKDYQNMGVATMICDEIESVFKVDKYTTHASITARPFFEKRGYKVVKEQHINRDGILLTNYVMEKEYKSEE